MLTQEAIARKQKFLRMASSGTLAGQNHGPPFDAARQTVRPKTDVFLCQRAFAAALNLGFVLFSAQLPLVTGNLHSMVDCALIGLALSAFRSESILRDAVVPVPRPPQTQTA